MKKIIMIAAMILMFATSAMAADVLLTVTVPDAWVQPTIAAVTDMWPIPDTWLPGVAQGVRVKKWTEHRIRVWLQEIVAPYKNKMDKAAALEASGFVPIANDSVPILIEDETPPE